MNYYVGRSIKKKRLQWDPIGPRVLQTGLSGNIMILSVLYKGGLLMAYQHLSVGELSSFLMYTFWVGISIAGKLPMLIFTSCPFMPVPYQTQGLIFYRSEFFLL